MKKAVARSKGNCPPHAFSHVRSEKSKEGETHVNRLSTRRRRVNVPLREVKKFPPLLQIRYLSRYQRRAYLNPLAKVALEALALRAIFSPSSLYLSSSAK